MDKYQEIFRRINTQSYKFKVTEVKWGNIKIQKIKITIQQKYLTRIERRDEN